MPRESLERKAGRLLAEGRVHVRRVIGDQVHAVVPGDHDTYEVRCSSARWSCTCPAWRETCSHVAAVQLVTVPRRA